MTTSNDNHSRQAPSSARPRSVQGSRTVEQTMMILQRLATEGPGGVRELERHLGISKSTVHRILSALESSEMVVFRFDTQSYEIGPGFLTLLSAFNQRNELINAARGPVHELHRQTGETVEISVIVAHSRLILYAMESDLPLRYASLVGSLNPLHSGSTGRTLLATCTDAELDEHIASMSFDPVSPRTITDRALFREKVLETRDRGYEASWEESYEGLAGCSVPVACRSPRNVALGIYGPSSRFTEEGLQGYVKLLRGAAAEIEHKLGTNDQL
jgi:IclR family KDG regulon transcriptional repressor